MSMLRTLAAAAERAVTRVGKDSGTGTVTPAAPKTFERPAPSPAIILSEKLLQLITRNMSPTASVQLPGASLRTDDAADGEANLKLLLQQILRSLGIDGSQSAPRATAHSKLPDPFGLALYQSVGGASGALAAQTRGALEAEFLRRLIQQKSAPDQSEEYGQRWLFELPVNFQDRVRPVSVRIFEKAKKPRATAERASWAAQFTFELPHSGCLEIYAFIAGYEITVDIACELAATANLLAQHQQSLRDKLTGFGLQLTELRCEVRHKDTFAPTQATFDARNTRPMPLQDFRMHKNATLLVPGIKIPDLMYCAMASLFDYTLDIEDTGLGHFAS